MKQRSEVNWVVFLFITLLIVSGLLTGFRLRESSDVQFHDTYVVIHNVWVLVLTGIILTIVYLITFGLKRIATVSHTLRITATLIAGLIGLGLTTVLILNITAFSGIHFLEQSIPSYGLAVLLLGLAILFVLRASEIWKVGIKSYRR